MPKKNRKAYSLLELSLVITIISILISGAMTTAVGNINNARVKVTKDKMKVLQDALGNYLSNNGSLPCPADITALKSSSTYATSVGTTPSTCASATYTNSNLVYGMVPAVTLGLSKDFAEDGFEDKIAYVVDKNFTQAVTSFSSSPDFTVTTTRSYLNFSIYAYNNTSNNITVREKTGSSNETVTTNAVFILISYGANKYGAYGANATAPNTLSTDADEMENDLGGTPNFDNTFVSVSANSDTFDDIITVYLNPQQLVSMFNLYRLIPCNNNLDTKYNTNTTTTTSNGTISTIPNPTTSNDVSYNAWFGQTVYGKACSDTSISCVSSTDTDKNYTKKCGPYGNWIVINDCCALPQQLQSSLQKRVAAPAGAAG